jgi:hypothetical protein
MVAHPFECRHGKRRLHLEALEVREVPATLRWTNALGTGLAGAYGNWEVLVGSSWQTAPVPPAWGDTLLFDGAVSNAHCVGGVRVRFGRRHRGLRGD